MPVRSNPVRTRTNNTTPTPPTCILYKIQARSGFSPYFCIARTSLMADNSGGPSYLRTSLAVGCVWQCAGCERSSRMNDVPGYAGRALYDAITESCGDWYEEHVLGVESNLKRRVGQACTREHKEGNKRRRETMEEQGVSCNIIMCFMHLAQKQPQSFLNFPEPRLPKAAAWVVQLAHRHNHAFDAQSVRCQQMHSSTTCMRGSSVAQKAMCADICVSLPSLSMPSSKLPRLALTTNRAASAMHRLAMHMSEHVR